MSRAQTGVHFHDLGVGDTFDFIDDAQPSAYNGFCHRCVKVSARCYRDLERPGSAKMEVGTIRCRVFHVERVQT